MGLTAICKGLGAFIFTEGVPVRTENQISAIMVMKPAEDGCRCTATLVSITPNLPIERHIDWRLHNRPHVHGDDLGVPNHNFAIDDGGVLAC
jgi:hypothetical protein